MKIEKAIVDGNRTAERVLNWNNIGEISVVTEGDNPSADVMLLKAKKDAETVKRTGFVSRLKEWVGKMGYGEQPRTVDQILMADEFAEQFCNLRYAFNESVYSILQTADVSQMAELMRTTVDQFSKRVNTIVQSMSSGDQAKLADLNDLLEKLQCEAVALHESKGAAEKRSPLAATLLKLDGFELPQFAGPANSNVDTIQTGKALSQTLEEDVPAEKAGKATEQKMSEEMKAQIEAIKAMEARLAKMEELAKLAQSAADNATKRADAAEARANATDSELGKLREEKSLFVFTAKANALRVGEPKKVASVLQRNYGISQEAGMELEDVLASASKMVQVAEKVLGSNIGHAVGNAGVEDDTAMGKLNAMAKAHQEKNPNLTPAQAWNVVANANPALKKQAVAEGKR